MQVAAAYDRCQPRRATNISRAQRIKVQAVLIPAPSMKRGVLLSVAAAAGCVSVYHTVGGTPRAVAEAQQPVVDRQRLSRHHGNLKLVQVIFR